MKFKGKIELTLKGFGFLICEDKNQKDIFILKRNLNNAMDGDVVIVETLNKTKKPEGIVVEIVARRNNNIVGTFHKDKKNSYGFVIADDKNVYLDIFIPKGQALSAKDDDKVVVKITKWPDSEKRSPEGEITENLGNKNKKGVDILSVIKKFDINEKFQKQVLAEGTKIPGLVTNKDLNDRLDLREHKIVTIDGMDSKDLDDAISLLKLDNGHFKLGVHIADVAHYVQENSELDREAFERSTSTYLIDTVIPMLPENLSNGICSLNPNVDRLTISCIMEINHKGNVVNHEIVESVIKTTNRLVYTEVSDNLESKNPDQYYKTMEDLALILKKKRYQRGTIDFEFAEPYIVLDKKGKAVDVKIRDRRIANKIIEEFMILANETVAEYVHHFNLPFVFRVHKQPSEEKIMIFNKFLDNLGYRIKGKQGEVHPKALQAIQAKIAGSPEEDIVNKMMLRSLRQAKYSVKNEGHFGLASSYYCHFTSPIRRYPDLVVHRILKDIIKNKITKTRVKELEEMARTVSLQASEQERISEKAERDVYDMKKAEYMEDKVGDIFLGTISSVLRFGFFVELANCVEGLVRVENLKDDYYIFDEQRMSLSGEHNKKTFKIGDKVKVLLAKVSVERREVDFELLPRDRKVKES
ncbi:MAG: ribonuclease R [bacterium]|nr:ribonuclease R [bacterium]